MSRGPVVERPGDPSPLVQIDKQFAESDFLSRFVQILDRFLVTTLLRPGSYLLNSQLPSKTRIYFSFRIAAHVKRASTAFGRLHPTSVRAGTKLGDVALSYGACAFDGITGLGLGEHGDAGQHYVIETSIALSLLDPGMRTDSFLVHWTMACANDFVEVDPPGVVPTPAPLILLLAGVASLLTRRTAKT